EEEMEFLINVIKSIASYNGTNMILTSDHGFIYDHNHLHESEFLTTSPAGKIWKKNRRFVIGQELKVEGGFVVFDGPTLGLQDGIQVAFPKELKRLRISGAGSQFVHGGLRDRKSTRLNSSHVKSSYAVFCLKKKNGAGLR